MERSAQPTGNATPADIDRNGRPTSIGMGGRHQAGINGRLRRNAHHMLGPHDNIGTEGTTQAAAIMGVAARFNAVSEGLATAPERHAPIFERTDDGTVLAGPWCMGFLAAMKLRCEAWRPLLDLSRIEHALLLPILLHCTDEAGYPMLGPTRPGPEGEAFLRNAYHDIPVTVPAIRDYWMPQRVRECSA